MLGRLCRRSGERGIQASPETRSRYPDTSSVSRWIPSRGNILILVKIQHANRRPARIPHRLEATLRGVNGSIRDPMAISGRFAMLSLVFFTGYFGHRCLISISHTFVHPFGDSTRCGIFNAASCLPVVVVVFRGLRPRRGKQSCRDTADERRKSKVRRRINQVAKIPGSRRELRSSGSCDFPTTQLPRCGRRRDEETRGIADSRPRLRGIASRSRETVQLLCIHRDLALSHPLRLPPQK